MSDPSENKALFPPTKKRGFWRRLLRFFLFAALVFILLITVAALVLRISFPPEKLRAMATRATEEQFKRRLHVGPVHLNPFRGFEFSDIRLLPLADSVDQDDMFPVRLGTVKKLILKYSFSELLHKRIRINEIIVDSPTLEYFVDLSTPSTLRVPDMPLLVNLDLLRLKNVQFKIIAADSTVEQKVFVGRLEFLLADLKLPKGKIVRQGDQVSGDFQLTCPETDFSFAQRSKLPGDSSSIFAKAKLDLLTDVSVHGFKDIRLHFRLALDRLSFSMLGNSLPSPTQIPVPLELDLVSTANMDQDSIHIERFAWRVNHQDWIDIAGSICGILSRPRFSLTVQESAVSIKQVLELARPFMPDSVLRTIHLVNDQAAFSMKGSSVYGILPKTGQAGDLQFLARATLQDFGLGYQDDAIKLKDLNIHADLAGAIDSTGLAGLKADLAAKYRFFSALLPDSSQFYTDAGFLRASTRLNESLLPVAAACSLSVANILGADLSGKLTLAGTNSIHSLRGKGYLQLTNMHLDSLPNSTVHAQIGAHLHVDVNTLDKISADLSVETDSLVMGQGEERLSLAPLRFLARLSGRADTSLQNIYLDSLTLLLNNLVQGFAHGEIADYGKKFSFKIPNLQLSHQAVLNYLPERLKERMEEMTVSGFTRLTARAEGNAAGATPEYSLNAHIFTDQTNLSYPEQFLSIQGIRADISANVNSETGTLTEMSLQIDSLRYDSATPMLLANNEIRLTLTSKDFTSLHVLDGKLNLPHFKIAGDFSARVDELSVNPHTILQMNLRQSAEDTLTLLPGIKLRGMSEAAFAIEADTALVDISAHIKTKDLSIFMPNDMRVRNIRADVHLHQQFDLLHAKLLGSEQNRILTPTDGSIDYLIYRSYYRNSLPNLSSVTIDRIEAAGYVLDNLRLEFYLGEGRLEVPSLMADVYSGNIGGRMSLDLTAGELAAATYKISSHFSGINSDLLLPQTVSKGKQGIINANMELSGRGLDPEQPMDLTGHFYITEIGPKVADNLLRSLDPQGTDAGIRSTRLLINRGFKPKLMTFEIRHGYFYPTILFAQPWYFPVRLSGGKIELSRIPIAFVIQTAMQPVTGG